MPQCDATRGLRDTSYPATVVNNSMYSMHLANMVPHLEISKDSGICRIKFKDASEIRFQIAIGGKRTPRAYGPTDSMAQACLRDLASLDSTEERCVFSFHDKSKFEFELNQLIGGWTRYPKVAGDMPRVIVASEETWSSFALFDPNAYPQRAKTLAVGCANHSALLFFHLSQLLQSLRADIATLEDLLSGNAGRPSPLAEFPGNEIQIEHDGVALTVSVSGALSELKSLLDSFAHLISTLVGRGIASTFGKATINGEELSGGRIVNSLRRCCPSDFTKGKDLADYIEAQSRAWISKAIILRDQAIHQLEIGSFRKVRAVAARAAAGQIFNVTLLPVVIAETQVEDYFLRLIQNLRDFIREVLRYFPEVKTTELPWEKFGAPWIPTCTGPAEKAG